MPKRNSTVVGREFGDGVRDAIEQCGLTQRMLAVVLNWQEAKISDMVNGKGGVTEIELVRVLSYCRTPNDEVDRLVALHRESRERGWLQFPEDGVPEQVHSLISQERLANLVTVWSMNLVPGHLQIAAYMRAAAEKSAKIKPADIDALIHAKLDRQAILKPGRQFVFYVHEQALRLPVGGADVMRSQLTHILMLLVRQYITLRVVPTAIGAHAGMSGSFTQLSFDRYQPVVFIESENSGLFLDDTASLESYSAVLKRLDQEALDAEQSRRLITAMLA
ncbi:helix-turn-helix domain-containing protein [Lentzea sp. JNUCC 0626]|uniref:helix-turn-helix domain-containing protein n=1 Tax=Lentzea sp. JNUCC 0626 TaxID=3367513 RepID=UPI003749BFA4